MCGVCSKEIPAGLCRNIKQNAASAYINILLIIRRVFRTGDKMQERKKSLQEINGFQKNANLLYHSVKRNSPYIPRVAAQ